MKAIYLLVCVSLLFAGCQTASNDSSKAAFEKNSKTAMVAIDGFQNESIDYSIYAASAQHFGTAYGEKDSLSLDEIKASDKQNWTMFDFELQRPIVLLQGVNQATGQPDGSVRYYGTWKVSVAATDSTAAKSGMVKVYESYDFDADGKIVGQTVYGDFGGIMGYLFAK